MSTTWKPEWEIEFSNPWTLRAECPFCHTTTIPYNLGYYQNYIAGRKTRCMTCFRYSSAPIIPAQTRF